MLGNHILKYVEVGDPVHRRERAPYKRNLLSRIKSEFGFAPARALYPSIIQLGKIFNQPSFPSQNNFRMSSRLR